MSISTSSKKKKATINAGKDLIGSIFSCFHGNFRAIIIISLVALWNFGLAAIHMIFHREPLRISGIIGYWGVPSSTLDWCELNYIWSPYIAEFWNTLSSFVMMALAVLSIFLHLHLKYFRFHLFFISMFVVAVGTALFHATLQHKCQLLDEIPLVWMVLVAAFNIAENLPSKQQKQRFGTWFPLLLTVWGLTIGAYIWFAPTTSSNEYYYYFYDGFPHQILSRVLLCTSFVLPSVYGLQRIISFAMSRASDPIRHFLWLGVGFYTLTYTFWLLDLLACDLLQQFPIQLELHALWHLTAFYMLHTMAVVVMYMKLTTTSNNSFGNNKNKNNNTKYDSKSTATAITPYFWFGFFPALH